MEKPCKQWLRTGAGTTNQTRDLLITRQLQDRFKSSAKSPAPFARLLRVRQELPDIWTIVFAGPRIDSRNPARFKLYPH
jgi:hypothetical protein